MENIESSVEKTINKTTNALVKELEVLNDKELHINTSNMQKNRAFMRYFCIITQFWCGRQELKTSSKRGIPLFSRLTAFEHHTAHQEFL